MNYLYNVPDKDGLTIGMISQSAGIVQVLSPEHVKYDLRKFAALGLFTQLNAVLTVEMSMAASHQGRGWEKFTDAVIRRVNARAEPTVFLLWGSHAQKKAAFVDSVDRGGRHLVLKSPHPSPLSARRGFFGSRPFSRANELLERQGASPVDWRVDGEPRLS
jgi:uracil DNA glycosylase